MKSERRKPLTFLWGSVKVGVGRDVGFVGGGVPDAPRYCVYGVRGVGDAAPYDIRALWNHPVRLCLPPLQGGEFGQGQGGHVGPPLHFAE